MVQAMLTMSFVIPASVIATEFSRARSGGAVGLGLSEMSIINRLYMQLQADVLYTVHPQLSEPLWSGGCAKVF